MITELFICCIKTCKNRLIELNLKTRNPNPVPHDAIIPTIIITSASKEEDNVINSSELSDSFYNRKESNYPKATISCFQGGRNIKTNVNIK